MLLLHEFNFVIQHRPGTQHVIADFLSRVDNSDNAPRQDDDFPDANILRVTTMMLREETNFSDHWLMAMTYFLTTGLPPPQLRMDEKK